MNFDVSDFLIVCGVALVGAGVWLIYPPAALIVLGAACLLAGVRAAR